MIIVDINSYRGTINELIALERKLREVKTLHSLNRINTSDAKEQVELLERAIRDVAAKLPDHERELFLHRRESAYYGWGG
ncbi:MAG: hypothetical protein HYY37_02640 [Candidatus Aenigmarchaeota archaeon]|nr:hypothetical protein [Candidatus Aenigmarchaeota archaeon]